MVTSNYKKIYQAIVPLVFCLGYFAPDFDVSSMQQMVSSWPELCLFHRWTDWECPGCGLTRSVISFFTYQFQLSFYYNPIGFFLGLAIVIGWLLSFSGDRLARARISFLAFIRRRALSALIITLAWGVLRNF